ncbi:MAG: hypothetical protein SNF68_04555 [Rikenellaceae bacterium]
MLLLTVTEFRNNISKYLQLAFTEKIALKSKGGIIELQPSTELRTSNPSPSRDPFYDNPQNVEHLNRAIEESHAEDAKRYSWDEIKQELGI